MTPVADAPPSYLSEEAIRLIPNGVGFTQAATQQPAALRLTVPSHVTRSTWFRPVLDRLREVVALPDGWDTYRSERVAIEAAEDMIGFLTRDLGAADVAPPWIVPLADGGLQIEWHRGGLDVEVTFPREDPPEMYVRDLESGEEWEGSLAEVAPQLRLAFASRLRLGE